MSRIEELSTTGKIMMFATNKVALIHTKLVFGQFDNGEELKKSLSDIIEAIDKFNGETNSEGGTSDRIKP